MPQPTEYVNELMQLALSCMRGRAPEVSERLVEALGAIERRELANLDERMRAWSVSPPDGWHAIDPARLTTSAAPWAVAAVTASHSNGRVREAAVRLLGETREARGLPFVLIRLNDWVDQVRRAARAAVYAYLRPELAPVFIALLPTLEGLRAKGRDQHETVISWVFTMLAHPDQRTARLAGCRSDDLESRRACFRFSLDMVPADAQTLLELAIVDHEPGIRSWAVRRAAVELPAASARAIAERGLRDPSAQVRKFALTVLADSIAPAELVVLTEHVLLDEGSATRWHARAIRSRAGAFDFAAFYRAALSRADNRGQTRGALLGLGESGDVRDAELVRQYLDSDAPSIRRVAMKALGQLEPVEVVDSFFDALSDTQPGVSGEARRALASRMRHVPTERVLEVLSTRDAPPHARVNAAALGRHLSKWDALLVALVSTRPFEPDTPAMLGAARNRLNAWIASYNRTFLAPTADQLTAIEASLRVARVDAGLRNELEQLLESARRVWA